MNPERAFLAETFYDAQQIDKAIQAGLSQAHFADIYNRELWGLLLELRGSGKPTDEAGVYAEASARGILAKLGGTERLLDASRLESHQSPTGTPWLSVLLDQHAKREACRRLAHAQSLLASNTASLEEIKAIAEEVAETCAGRRNECRDLNAIDAEITAEVAAAKTGKKDESRLIKWGVPKLDKFLTPIEPHEYVLICARPSRGKSSMLTQLAARNLYRGKRIAYFTLETSDKSVVKQMAAQIAKLNLKTMHEWMPEHYEAFDEAREYLRASGRLMVFDKDMDLPQIEARCRLLATTFKPDAVMLDYLGLVRAPGKSIYERVSTASKAMIPLKKALGCALIAGQQLKRQSDGQETEPGLGDLRDSGQLEEDAHRVVMLHWKDSRLLDMETRDYRLLQPKLRDGPTTAVDGIKFHAPSTRFYEEA
jgi:replicative DNA helicase